MPDVDGTDWPATLPEVRYTVVSAPAARTYRPLSSCTTSPSIASVSKCLATMSRRAPVNRRIASSTDTAAAAARARTAVI